MVGTDALARSFDSLLLDLDGVVYSGRSAIPNAVPALQEIGAAGLRLCYVTNNASRPPAAVVEQLSGFGLSVSADDVLTSAQAGAALVAEQIAADSTVLAVGGPGVGQALQERGLRVIDAVTDPMAATGDDVAAVLQGFGPDVNWKALARASLAVSSGVPWIATNTDLTLPVEAGVAPGNGTLVNAVAAATGRAPEVAGKPFPPLLLKAAERSQGLRPLVVGDRLDTDIEGAGNAQMASLLVMSGVSGALDLWRAPSTRRPRFLAADVSGLLLPPLVVSVSDGVAHAGAATVRIDRGTLVVQHDGDPLGAIWAAAHLLWDAAVEPDNSPDLAADLDAALHDARTGAHADGDPAAR